jgi:hypothetical protein
MATSQRTKSVSQQISLKKLASFSVYYTFVGRVSSPVCGDGTSVQPFKLLYDLEEGL